MNQAGYLKKTRFVLPKRISGFPESCQEVGYHNGRPLLVQGDKYIGEWFAKQRLPQLDGSQNGFDLGQVIQTVTRPGNGRAARPQLGAGFRGTG